MDKINRSKSLFGTQQVNQYLARIHCLVELNPTLRYLRQLHRQHLLTIPFENLDNFMNHQILLDVEKVFRKITVSRRGGFCYELNGIFHQLLLALGYDAFLVSARVYHSTDYLGAEFDHMAIVVNLNDDQYLVDVGYGESFRSPLKIVPGLVQMDFREYYKVSKDINDVYTLQYSKDSINFSDRYQFTLEKRNLIEFIDMCHFHHKNSKSHLVQSIYVHQPTKNGQLILTNNQLTIEADGQSEVSLIHNQDEFVVKLKQHFNLDFKRNQ